MATFGLQGPCLALMVSSRPLWLHLGLQGLVWPYAGPVWPRQSHPSLHGLLWLPRPRLTSTASSQPLWSLLALFDLRAFTTG
jgi:hypothetical protein